MGIQRRKLQSEYPTKSELRKEIGKTKDYWMDSEPDPARSFKPAAGFGNLSLSHFSRNCWEFAVTLRKRNPTRPLRSAHAISVSMSMERLVSGSVNCKRGLAFLGSAWCNCSAMPPSLMSVLVLFSS